MTDFNNGDKCVTRVDARPLFRQPILTDMITLISCGSREVVTKQTLSG